MSDTPLTLSDWIAAATVGLPPSATAKFSAEIEDHFAESRQKFLDEDMASDEAERAALASLGDPARIGLTLRDTHFSRRIYGRACLAGLIIFVLYAASLLIPVLGVWRNGWFLPIQIISNALSIVVVYGMIVLLREQYEINTPQWAWIAFSISVMLPAGLDAALNLLRFYPPGFAYLFTSVVYGGLLGGFSIKWLASGGSKRRLFLSAVLSLGTIVGGITLFGNGLYLLDPVLQLPHFLFTANDLLVSVFFVLVHLLNLLLLGLMLHMRRQGAAIVG